MILFSILVSLFISCEGRAQSPPVRIYVQDELLPLIKKATKDFPKSKNLKFTASVKETPDFRILIRYHADSAADLHLLGYFGVTIIVNPRRGETLRKLVQRQLTAILVDKSITDFTKLNPTLLGRINMVERNDGSLVASIFNETVFDSVARSAPTNSPQASDEEIINTVANDENAMGVVALHSVTSAVTPVGYGADWAYVTLPTAENIIAGKYKMAARVYLQSAQKSHKSDLMEYFSSPKGLQDLKAAGLIPAN